ncbi:Uncharacterised protein [Segatella copri]|nr:Uncharacterised protein [Segatella copri]
MAESRRFSLYGDALDSWAIVDDDQTISIISIFLRHQVFVGNRYVCNICHTHYIDIILWFHYLFVPVWFLSGILKREWFLEISQQKLFKQLLAIFK